MGQISRQLARRFDTDHRGLRLLREKIGKVLSGAAGVPDPVHSAYVRVQNLTSAFAEAVSPLPELKPYHEAAGNAEEEYMPIGPPMSPLTSSYFTTWAFFDLRFGHDLETVGSVLLDVSQHLKLSDSDFAVARQLQQSRMGLYEVCDAVDSMCRLRELVTDDEFGCYVPAGYHGRPGELWYARLCPPIPGCDYHVVFTTPYVLRGASKGDWIAYLERSLDTQANGDLRARLFHLLKYGRHTNGWNEYVFQAYCDHESGAVFLTGLPDVPESLPHADPTGKRPCG
ncbi:MAG: hypothetical protein JW741_16055 [Sedimentisphaerales bacterium]|nr:hypothetical protein [Sedimentisphaerales bacterium]